MLKTLAHSLPIGYQDSDNHFINQELSNIVPGLSRRKQGLDSPWGHHSFGLFFENGKCLLLAENQRRDIFCVRLVSGFQGDCIPTISLGLAYQCQFTPWILSKFGAIWL